jgi:hypothetical protein
MGASFFDHLLVRTTGELICPGGKGASWSWVTQIPGFLDTRWQRAKGAVLAGTRTEGLFTYRWNMRLG